MINTERKKKRKSMRRREGERERVTERSML